MFWKTRGYVCLQRKEYLFFSVNVEGVEVQANRVIWKISSKSISQSLWTKVVWKNFVLRKKRNWEGFGLKSNCILTGSMHVFFNLSEKAKNLLKYFCWEFFHKSLTLKRSFIVKLCVHFDLWSLIFDLRKNGHRLTLMSLFTPTPPNSPGTFFGVKWKVWPK